MWKKIDAHCADGVGAEISKVQLKQTERWTTTSKEKNENKVNVKVTSLTYDQEGT